MNGNALSDAILFFVLALLAMILALRLHERSMSAQHMRAPSDSPNAAADLNNPSTMAVISNVDEYLRQKYGL